MISRIKKKRRKVVDRIALLLLKFIRILNPVSDYQEKKLAYYIWHFPVLSQTFIQREIHSIKKCNISVDIFADGYEDPELYDDISRKLSQETDYILPIDKDRLNIYKKDFFSKKPVTYILLYIFVLLFKYREKKNISDDIKLYTKAIYLAGIIMDKNINHIHSPWANLSAFVCLLVSILSGIRYSVQARAYDIHRKTSLYALKPILRYSDFIVTNCDYNKNYLEHYLNEYQKNKIIKIYEGVDPETIKPGENTGNSNKQINILTVARITEQKGLNYLLEACKTLRDRGVLFKSEIIGANVNKNYFDELLRLRNSLELTDVVFFLGPKPFCEILEKYRHTDIVVLPCVIAADGSRDITPNTLIEASAMKIPVVSTNITGIPEIIDDGITGILIAPGDAKALSGAILKLTGNKQLRIQMGENGRKKVLDKFDINENVKEYLKLYKK